MQVTLLGVALGWWVRVEQVALVGLGALFALFGLPLPRVPRNPLIGFRTPWTLVSDAGFSFGWSRRYIDHRGR